MTIIIKKGKTPRLGDYSLDFYIFTPDMTLRQDEAAPPKGKFSDSDLSQEGENDQDKDDAIEMQEATPEEQKDSELSTNDDEANDKKSDLNAGLMPDDQFEFLDSITLNESSLGEEIFPIIAEKLSEKVKIFFFFFFDNEFFVLFLCPFF